MFCCCSSCSHGGDLTPRKGRGRASSDHHAHPVNPHLRSDSFRSSSRMERAKQELLAHLHSNASSAPSVTWRAKYGKLRDIGSVATVVIATFLTRMEEAPGQESQPPKSGSISVTGSLSLTPKTELGLRPLRARRSSVRATQHAFSTLDLRNLRIHDSDFAKLVPALMEDSTVRTVYFGGNFITDAGIDALVEQVRDGCGSSIETISLSQNLMTVKGLVEFLLFSPNLASLCRLDISVVSQKDNEFSDAAFQSKVREMRSSLLQSSIKQFHFRGNGISSSALRVVLCDVLQQCSAVHHFVCLGVIFSASKSKKPVANDEPVSEDEEAKYNPIYVLGKILSDPCRGLSCVILRSPLNEDSVARLAKGIESSKSLTKLVLSHCDLTAECFRILGRSLGHNRSLKYLDLSYPNASVADPKAQSGHLQRQTSYESGGSGIRTQHTAEAESLSERPLGPLVNSLRAGSVIEELILVGVGLSVLDVEMLCDTIELYQNRSLLHVSLTFASSVALLLKLNNLILQNRSFISQ